MLWGKKREGHAGDELEETDQTIDFAWLVFIGMQIGYKEMDIAHMSFKKWAELYEAYKEHHNFIMSKGIYKRQQPQNDSLMDL